jgi:predicted nucleic acid-binding protein
MTLLVDTGPLVAVIDPVDSYHTECMATLRALDREPMITTWQCFTEAMHFLGRNGRVYLQDRLWDMRSAGLLAIHSTSDQETDRIEALMRQYQSSRIDLADASIIAAAESLSLLRVFTVDRGFFYFQLSDGAYPLVIR